jgi:hypothetical protein
MDATEAGVVIEKPTVAKSDYGWLYMVPFQEGVCSEWLPAVLNKLTASLKTRSDEPAALFVHMGLRDATARQNPWAAKAADAIDVEVLADLCRKHQIGHVFAGNWHTHQQWQFEFDCGFKVLLTQVGALVPTGWDNPGIDGYGGIAVFGHSGVTVREVPGPRFVTVTTDAELAAVPISDNVYARYVCPPERAAHATFTCQAATKAKAIRHWEVKIDSAEVNAGARAGAQAASDSQTLHEALGRYVAELSTPPDVKSERVLTLCAAMLGLSSGGGK